ncbi:MAG: DedA family protein, partial [Bacteroidota bacterium]
TLDQSKAITGVFAGSLVGIGRLDFILAAGTAIVGSTTGFMTMYAIGHQFGDKIVETGKLKLIPREQLQKVEDWFRRYGYGVVVVNRFLAGTRAVVSFFAGLSKLSFAVASGLAFVSTAVWNLILVSGGNELGKNWRTIAQLITTYSQVISAVILLVIAIWLIRLLVRRNNKQ